MAGRPPALGYAKKLIPVSQIFPFGARVKIICNVPSQRTLLAHTVGDPRTPQGSVIYPAELQTLNDTSGFDALFMGYSSHPTVALLLKPSGKSNCILCGHQIIIDPFGVLVNPSIDKLRLNEVLF